ncbi:MAG: hypothetical protein IJC84_00815 [Clostridia bacterium]|nr:hypothetical protein [Clostridia bacterium]
MDSLSDKLSSVLSDPESMAKIASLAKSFAASQKNKEEKAEFEAKRESALSGVPAPPGEENPFRDLLRVPAIQKALQMLGDGSRERIALLSAMRPFVREEKREKLDHIISTMKMLDIISSAQKLI